MSPILNGSSSKTPKLSPAQQRQLEADTHPDTPSSPSQKRTRKTSNPPNLLSEGDFPSLGPSKPTPPRPVVSSWGAKRPPSIVPQHHHHHQQQQQTNGVNGRSSTANSSRSPTPAPTPTASRTQPVPGTKNLQSQSVTELVRFTKGQLAIPNAKEFPQIGDKIAKFTGVDKIVVSRMKVSEVVTFSITGRPENVVKARNRLQNEVGIKVIPPKNRADNRESKRCLLRPRCCRSLLARRA